MDRKRSGHVMNSSFGCLFRFRLVSWAALKPGLLCQAEGRGEFPGFHRFTCSGGVNKAKHTNRLLKSKQTLLTLWPQRKVQQQKESGVFLDVDSAVGCVWCGSVMTDRVLPGFGRRWRVTECVWGRDRKSTVYTGGPSPRPPIGRRLCRARKWSPAAAD